MTISSTRNLPKAILSQITEADVEAEVRQLLEMTGYRVLKASVKIRSTNPIHHRTGQSKGIADLLVTHDKWGLSLWVGLELKRPLGGKFSSPEQEELARLGLNVVVTSAEEALAAVRRVDEKLRPGR